MITSVIPAQAGIQPPAVIPRLDRGIQSLFLFVIRCPKFFLLSSPLGPLPVQRLTSLITLSSFLFSISCHIYHNFP
jgi:hypothetical protein